VLYAISYTLLFPTGFACLAERSRFDEPPMKTLPAWTAPLRDWQRRALSAVCAHPAMDFLAMATPAAGKTRFALAVAHHYLTAGAAVRVLVVCPTNHLRGQWSDAAGKIGLHLDPALTNEQAVEASDYHGAVVTYQQVCLAPAIFQRACKSKKTLLILDELHHGHGRDGLADRGQAIGRDRPRGQEVLEVGHAVAARVHGLAVLVHPQRAAGRAGRR